MTGFAVGLAGTAKNTGKTTVLRALLSAAAGAGCRLGLTSIGYDGEDTDHVTGLPKPRVTVPAGTWVATAATATAGRSEFAEVRRPGVSTALGPLVIVRARRPARTVLAGPATRAGLERILAELRPGGAGLILVDGAFGRLVPMSACDGLIIATGAARFADPTRVAAEMAAVCSLLSLPVRPGWDCEPSGVELHSPRGVVALPYPALLAVEWAERVGQAAERLAGAGPVRVFLPGCQTPAALERLGACLPDSAEVVFAHALYLLATGEPEETALAVDALRRRGVQVGVRRVIPLLAVTVNPFYPQAGEGGRFAPAYADSGVLLAEVRSRCPVPVSDIFKDGPGPVWEAVWQGQQRATAGSRGRTM